jgi:4-carboxymuconolactone decarboxylase
MKYGLAVLAGVLAGACLTAAALTGVAAQDASTATPTVRRAEPFTRLTTRRIEPVDPAKYTDAQRAYITSGGGGSNQVKVCMHNLEVCRKFWDFTSQLTSRYSIPLRDKELLILRTAWLSRGDYVWGRHSTGSGKKAGLTDEDLARIIKGPGAPGWSGFDAALLRAADELHTSRFISDTTWKALSEKYDKSQMLEVVFTVGDYTTLAMFHNSVGLPLEDGIKGLPD